MRLEKNIHEIKIRINHKQYEKLHACGLSNISEVIRRCIDKVDLLDITGLKKGQILQAIDTFKFDDTKKNVLIVGKEYVIKDVTEFDGELWIIIESEVSKKHNFDVDTINQYFILI